MTFRTRYMLIAAFNCALLLGFLYLSISKGWDTSKRLIDVNIEHHNDLNMVFAYIGLLMVALLINVVLISSRKGEITLDELRKLINTMN